MCVSNDSDRLQFLISKAIEVSAKHRDHIQQINDTHDYVHHLCSRLSTDQNVTISMEIEGTIHDLLKQVEISMDEIKNEQNQLETMFTEMFNINVRLRDEPNNQSLYNV